MKKISIVIILLVSVYIPVSGQYSKSEKIALELLNKYNKDGYFILTEYMKAPSSYKFKNASTSLSKNNNFGRYIRGNKEQDIVNSLGTVVHEMNHAFTGLFALQHIDEFDFKTGYDCYYIKDGKYIIVKLTETFPGKKIESDVPDEFKTFRFKTYISHAPKFQSTQSSGIYGLLDEFNAYYQGTKTNILMYDYYMNETAGNVKDWQQYMSNVDGSFYAYAEFKFYILKYLIYAKKYERDIYNGIITNESFKDAFNAVDLAFSEMITSYFDIRKNILKSFEETGHDVKMENNFTYIDGSGTGNFMDVYTLLMHELENPVYVTILKSLN